MPETSSGPHPLAELPPLPPTPGAEVSLLPLPTPQQGTTQPPTSLQPSRNRSSSHYHQPTHLSRCDLSVNNCTSRRGFFCRADFNIRYLNTQDVNCYSAFIHSCVNEYHDNQTNYDLQSLCKSGESRYTCVENWDLHPSFCFCLFDDENRKVKACMYEAWKITDIRV